MDEPDTLGAGIGTVDAGAQPAEEGYTGASCAYCTRVRVYLRVDGQLQCERCGRFQLSPSPSLAERQAALRENASDPRARPNPTPGRVRVPIALDLLREWLDLPGDVTIAHAAVDSAAAVLHLELSSPNLAPVPPNEAAPVVVPRYGRSSAGAVLLDLPRYSTSLLGGAMALPFSHYRNR